MLMLFVSYGDTITEALKKWLKNGTTQSVHGSVFSSNINDLCSHY